MPPKHYGQLPSATDSLLLKEGQYGERLSINKYRIDSPGFSNKSGPDKLILKIETARF